MPPVARRRRTMLPMVIALTCSLLQVGAGEQVGAIENILFTVEVRISE